MTVFIHSLPFSNYKIKEENQNQSEAKENSITMQLQSSFTSRHCSHNQALHDENKASFTCTFMYTTKSSYLKCTLMYISTKRYLMKLENVMFGHNPKRIKNSNCSWITDLRQHMTSWGSELFLFFQISLQGELVKLRCQQQLRLMPGLKLPF